MFNPWLILMYVSILLFAVGWVGLLAMIFFFPEDEVSTSDRPRSHVGPPRTNPYDWRREP